MAPRAIEQGGFGLIELLIAMTVMTIGIMAIVAGFSSAYVAINSASRTGTAGTLADKQMEAYRALPYTQIALKTTLLPSPQGTATANTTYTGDTALTGDTQTGNFSLKDTVLASTPAAYDGTYCNSSPVACTPLRTPVVGPGGGSYRVDTYMTWYCAVGTLRPANGSTTVLIGGVTYTQAAPGCLDATTNAVVSRPLKKVTVVVRDATTVTKTYFRETSTFDLGT